MLLICFLVFLLDANLRTNEMCCLSARVSVRKVQDKTGNFVVLLHLKVAGMKLYPVMFW